MIVVDATRQISMSMDVPNNKGLAALELSRVAPRGYTQCRLGGVGRRHAIGVGRAITSGQREIGVCLGRGGNRCINRVRYERRE